MHPYEFLTRYGPMALVAEVTDTPGEAFAAELAKGGFDLLLPCAEPTELEALEARLEDHEGIQVELFQGNIDDPRFPETLYSKSGAMDIGLLVCGIEPGHPRMAGSLLSSLTRVLLPRLRARAHSGVILIDVTGKARRLGETLAHELKPEGIDVLTLCADSSLIEELTPRELAKKAMQTIDRDTVLRFSPKRWSS